MKPVHMTIDELRAHFPRAIHPRPATPLFLMVITLLGLVLLAGMSFDVWKEWTAPRPTVESTFFWTDGQGNFSTVQTPTFYIRERRPEAK